MCKVIAIANQKGGVGKTTTSVNLSASIAVSERKTLIVDKEKVLSLANSSGIAIVGI